MNSYNKIKRESEVFQILIIHRILFSTQEYQRAAKLGH